MNSRNPPSLAAAASLTRVSRSSYAERTPWKVLRTVVRRVLVGTYVFEAELADG